MGEVNARAQLLEVVRQVRRRWRIKLALRGAVGFLLAGLRRDRRDRLHARGAQVHARRDLLRSASSPALVLVAAGAWFFARPLSRKVTDEQVALYLEEHEPTLDSTILSAMEATERPGDWSPDLIRRLDRKRDRARARDPGRRAHRARADEALRLDRRRGRGGRDCAVHVRPGVFPSHAVGDLRHLDATSKPRRRIAIDVKPGDATVAKGADQMISATLSGFDAADAAILIRKGSAGAVRARADGQGRERHRTRACCSISPSRSTTSSKPPACVRRRTS